MATTAMALPNPMTLNGHTQVGVEVSDEALGEERDAYHQAELLDEDDAGFDVNLGIEIVKMQTEQNADNDQCNAGEPAFVQEKDGGIDFKDEVRGVDERGGDQQDLR